MASLRHNMIPAAVLLLCCFAPWKGACAQTMKSDHWSPAELLEVDPGQLREARRLHRRIPPRPVTAACLTVRRRPPSLLTEQPDQWSATLSSLAWTTVGLLAAFTHHA